MRNDVATRAFIALGSNLGDREHALGYARTELGGSVGIRLIAATKPEETAPLGGVRQPAYLNQMIIVDTLLDPVRLLAQCHAIEARAGRVRRDRWESRILDIDLVRFGDMTCDLAELRLPHPGLRDRTFWMRELVELETRVGR